MARNAQAAIPRDRRRPLGADRLPGYRASYPSESSAPGWRPRVGGRFGAGRGYVVFQVLPRYGVSEPVRSDIRPGARSVGASATDTPVSSRPTCPAGSGRRSDRTNNPVARHARIGDRRLVGNGSEPPLVAARSWMGLLADRIGIWGQSSARDSPRNPKNTRQARASP